jgi:glycosyltransferase involved in cell wall biosynthesis
MVFSHQRDTVVGLAPHFSDVTVITRESADLEVPRNVKIIVVPWSSSKRLNSSLKFLLIALSLVVNNRKSVIFYHMTDFHCALLSPITSLFGCKNILWYAHASNSMALKFSSFFVQKIISSTRGSCNLSFNRHKVVYINQGVEPKDFPFTFRKQRLLSKFIYFGRLDESKNMHKLFDLITLLNTKRVSITLDFFGAPSTSSNLAYLEQLKLDHIKLLELKKININSPIPRKQIKSIAQKYGTFINLFDGSLDKTLIEATLLGLPVITWNREYYAQFGSWSKTRPTTSLAFIEVEIQALFAINSQDYRREILRRYQLALNNHSFDSWINRLKTLLRP